MFNFKYPKHKVNINFIFFYFQKKDISSTNEKDDLKDILLSDNLLDSIMNEQASNIKTEMEGIYHNFI